MSEDAEPLYVVVEGPAPGDALLLGRWLVAAAEADQTLQDQFNQNPRLKEQIGRLEVVRCIRFSSTATRSVELLMKNLTCFSLLLDEEWGEMFAVMADLGFFRLTGHWYQMTLPQQVSGSQIEIALLRLAATEDRDFELHPEHFVTCHSRFAAEEWKARLAGLSLDRASLH